MDKVVESAADAVADIGDGVTLATGGFGVCGIPSVLLKALQLRGSRDITLISNNCGIAGVGNSLLLENRQLSRLIARMQGKPGVAVAFIGEGAAGWSVVDHLPPHQDGRAIGHVQYRGGELFHHEDGDARPGEFGHLAVQLLDDERGQAHRQFVEQ